MSKITIWIEATRPKTLPAAVTPVLLGSSLAHANGQFAWQPGLICLLFAILVQIGTNFANDYFDAIKGADTAARLGPRRAVATGLIKPSQMRFYAISVLVVAFGFGLALIPYGGWWLLAVGTASVLSAWFYTGGPYPLAYNGLGDLFVVIFFGLVAVSCTYYVQAGVVTSEVLLLGLTIGLLINNLLIVNNYRDMDEDRSTHKYTTVVRFGRIFALRAYCFSGFFACIMPFVLVARGYNYIVLLALIPAVVAITKARSLRAASSASDFLNILKVSGWIVFIYGIFVSAGLVLG